MLSTWHEREGGNILIWGYVEGTHDISLNPSKLWVQMLCRKVK